MKKTNFISNILKQGLSVFVLLLLITALSCSKDGDTETSPTPKTKTPPGSFSLVAPTNGAESLSAEVSFSWKASEHATSYRLVIKQGSTTVHDQSYTGTSATVSLELGQSYTWQVTASNSDGTLASSNYSFTTMAEPADPVVTNLPQLKPFYFVRNEESETLGIGFYEALDYNNEEVSYTIEVLRQPCISCEPVSKEFRDVSSDADLKGLDNLEDIAITIVKFTISKYPPGQAQITLTKKFYH